MGGYRRLAAMSIAAALLFGAAFSSAVSAADGRCSGVYGITLFDYAAYGDPSSTFCGSAGHTTDYDNVGGMHDRTTSLQIFNRPVVGRTRVRAFKDPYFGGGYYDFYQSFSTMPSGWNNVLDSMILVP